METNDQALWEDTYNRIFALPPDKQRAVLWLIENFEFAESICKAGVLTQETRSLLRQQANQNNDALLLLLVELESIINNEKPNM